MEVKYILKVSEEEMQLIEFAVKEQLQIMEEWLKDAPRDSWVLEQKKKWRELTQKIIDTPF